MNPHTHGQHDGKNSGIAEEKKLVYTHEIPIIYIYILLYCIVLYCIILYYIILFHIILYYIILCYIVLYIIYIIEILLFCHIVLDGNASNLLQVSRVAWILTNSFGSCT